MVALFFMDRPPTQPLNASHVPGLRTATTQGPSLHLLLSRTWREIQTTTIAVAAIPGSRHPAGSPGRWHQGVPKKYVKVNKYTTGKVNQFLPDDILMKHGNATLLSH